jgi:hypothetical protein
MGCGASTPAVAADSVTIPLSGVVSSFNEAYKCTVQSATVTPSALNLTLSVAGDGSLGPLQGASSSSVVVGDTAFQPSMTQDDPAACSDNVWKGTLYYPRQGDGAVQIKAGDTVTFSFGSGGYSQVALFTLTPAFIAQWGLAAIL